MDITVLRVEKSYRTSILREVAGSVLLERDDLDCHSDLREDYAAIETG